MDLLPRLYAIHLATGPFEREELKRISCNFYSLKEAGTFITQHGISFIRVSPLG